MRGQRQGWGDTNVLYVRDGLEAKTNSFGFMFVEASSNWNSKIIMWVWYPHLIIHPWLWSRSFYMAVTWNYEFLSWQCLDLLIIIMYQPFNETNKKAAVCDNRCCMYCILLLLDRLMSLKVHQWELNLSVHVVTAVKEICKPSLQTYQVTAVPVTFTSSQPRTILEGKLSYQCWMENSTRWHTI